jgi:DinB family protein
VALLEPGEAAASYKAKILSYQAGADFLALQAAAPDRLAALIDGLTAAQLSQRPAPDKWSIQELVAHLADDELVGAYRLRMILSSPGTPLQAFDQDVWARIGRYSERDVRSSLQLFRVLRQANLELLRSLSADEWDMHGVHAERGVESIRDIAMYFAGHDINHFKQIEAMRQTDGH